MTSKRFHPGRKKKAAGDDVVARGTAAIFLTAAVRLLRDQYGWEEEAAADFGERLVGASMALAADVAALPVPAALGKPQTRDRTTAAAGDDAARPAAE